nr:MAG TPA: hypothetical protein [Caudoviricetes sp.]DAS35972.1 MAG TPA: hypothetical protein [Caudoviricetes sp.]
MFESIYLHQSSISVEGNNNLIAHRLELRKEVTIGF